MTVQTWSPHWSWSLLFWISQKVQEEVLKEYKKMKQVSGDIDLQYIWYRRFYRPQTSDVVSQPQQKLLLVWQLESDINCVCALFCFTAQPKLPWGETALRVPAQQVGPHQAANSWFWPAQSPVLVLRAQYTSSLISIENGVTNQEGVSNWLLFNTPSVTARTTATPPTFFPSHFLFHHPSSFLPSFPIFDSTGFIVACNLENPLWLNPPIFCFLFYFIFSQWAPVEFHATGQVEGAACMCEWVWGENLNSSNLLKDFIFRQKKKEQKKYFWASQKILTMYLS